MTTGTDAEVHVRVARRLTLAQGVVGLVLLSADGGSLPQWEPGAHIDLVLAPGLIRQYSLCGDPRDSSRWLVAVLRDDAGRGGSLHVHQKLLEGATLLARGPRSHFPLVTASSYLFLAGGIGITPFLPMIRQLSQQRAAWQLVYGGRHRASMAFLDDLCTFGGDVQVVPEDEAGRLPLGALLAEHVHGRVVYCCGPEGLLSSVEALCEQWPSGSLHVERFAPRAVETLPSTAFDVVCDVSGLTLHVPAERSVLDVLTEAGVDVLSSCTEGTCGSCETKVLKGTPDHRDSVLSDEDREAGQFMMVCVSRSSTPELVLDL